MADAVQRMALAESVGPYLEPGEEIVVVDGGQAVHFWKGRRGLQDLPTPEGVRFIKHEVGVVITTRRFLMFKTSGFPHYRAQEVLTDLSVAEVDSIVCEGHYFKSFEAKLTIRGIEYGFVVGHIGNCRDLEQALEAAKDGSASA